ncbi:MAG: hypothetical protein A3I05_00015 [Deltaproteobacteria bacterium RIFCSPLOWO2_02_FULL_44_10]|nr:MAG: hypothetical protein A3C46_02635 [Deltaproteobacteria bacterium RIFCSPHIGHO2_02_FULL_44_16]OGQ45559.1 MAG: hypothetical protein A3I05_00015 [Deltaproteobacteria bacterium RIFCSPLOWO2_02_FULL_44_10]
MIPTKDMVKWFFKHKVWPSLKWSMMLEIFFLLAAFIYVWFFDSHNIHAFSNALMIIGLLSMGLGTLSMFGGMTARGDAEYQLSRMAGVDGSKECFEQDRKDASGEFSFLLFMFTSGITAVIISLIIKKYT